MPSKQSIAESLTKLLDTSDRPLYVVDAQWRIAFCNAALAEWVALEPKQIIGRRVEFHSEAPKKDELVDAEAAPLTDLCPPPSSLAGEVGVGTISCLGRDGHLHHRAAEFVPLGRTVQRGKSHDPAGTNQCAVIVLLSRDDLTPQELAATTTGEPTPDELHRAIRRFRRAQAERYSLESLLGSSAAMQKVRAQVKAAAASDANALICGPRGSGRSHLARAIHYHSSGGQPDNLWVLDCQALTEDLLGRTLDRLRTARGAAGLRPTLLIENLEFMPNEHQAVILRVFQPGGLNARVLATLDTSPVAGREPSQSAYGSNTDAKPQRTKSKKSTEIEFKELPQDIADDVAGTPASRTLDPGLLNQLATITIRVPPLAERLEDVPILAQYFLESFNRTSSKQVGAIRSDALDSLAMYSWPGELIQLRKTIAAAHAACKSHAIAAADLPSVFYQAFRAAAHARQIPEPIVLDQLLAGIEKEAIVRALDQSGGNKSEAATLLGMTRPRLYRRLVQLGMAPPETAADAGAEAPEFIEQVEHETGDAEP